MIGGLTKTTSRLAIAAAASVLATSAMAADLGGNCCADLEERVAELEATTARKGNRRVSLTVYGHVNWGVFFWDDGFETNAYVLDNNNSRSRFGFRGDAKISADWSAGFLMEIGVRRNDSGSVTQDDPLVTPGGGVGLDIRHEALYVEHRVLGRVWLGWTSSATDGITEINLGGTPATAFDRSVYLGNFFANLPIYHGILINPDFFGQPNRLAVNWNTLASRAPANWSGDDSRRDIVRYVSPSFFGFTFSSSWGGDDFWDVALRYANEFNGVRVAGGIGYNRTLQFDDPNYSGGNTQSSPGCTQRERIFDPQPKIDCEHVGLSGSVMHVPTGLFVSGAWSWTRDNELNSFRVQPFFNGFDDTDTAWYVTGGIQKNWFGIGATTFYGEFGNYDKGGFTTLGGAGGFFASSEPANVLSSNVQFWSIGVNQTIDAAAMDLYMFYSRYTGDADVCLDGDLVTTACFGPTFDRVVNLDAHDLQMFVVGGIIRF